MTTTQMTEAEKFVLAHAGDTAALMSALDAAHVPVDQAGD